MPREVVFTAVIQESINRLSETATAASYVIDDVGLLCDDLSRATEAATEARQEPLSLASRRARWRRRLRDLEQQHSVAASHTSATLRLLREAERRAVNVERCSVYQERMEDYRTAQRDRDRLAARVAAQRDNEPIS